MKCLDYAHLSSNSEMFWLVCSRYFCQDYFPIPISHRYWNFRIIFAKETWWVLNWAPSPFSERKRKRSRRDRLHMRFFLQIGIKSEIYCLLKQSCFTWMLSTKFSRILFLQELQTSFGCSVVQQFIAVPFSLTFWNDAETADQHKEPMIDTKCPTPEKFVGQGQGWGCRKRAWPCNGHRSPSTWLLWWRQRRWGCANTWGNDDY